MTPQEQADEKLGERLVAGTLTEKEFLDAAQRGVFDGKLEYGKRVPSYWRDFYDKLGLCAACLFEPPPSKGICPDCFEPNYPPLTTNVRHCALMCESDADCGKSGAKCLDVPTEEALFSH